MLFTQQARSYEQTLGKNTAKGYWSAIDNFWGYVDVVLTQPEREALPADVLKHKRIPCTLAERFFGWLVEKRAPATQFKKYHNALVWAQKVRTLRARCARRACAPQCKRARAKHALNRSAHPCTTLLRAGARLRQRRPRG